MGKEKINLDLVAFQLAASAIYGAVAQTKPPQPPTDFLDKAIELVAGHIRAVMDMGATGKFEAE